ncbi:MAG: TlpA family protein disulfide reductase [Arachidicoccus sp.]|nr:TlpA family protein disulfide reductase [Arachidicoccus sp.]
MNRHSYIILIILFYCHNSYGQLIKTLQIGDTVPDITIHNLLNYKDTVAKLSDFKGQLLILDFWATWCGSCISQFPKMEKLGKRYNDNLKFVLVNSNNTGDKLHTIQKFFSERKERTGLGISSPIVFNDSLLLKMFPHRLLPHYVWLDSNLRVVNITSFGEMTIALLNRYLINGDLRSTTKTNDTFQLRQKDTIYVSQISAYQRIHPAEKMLRTGAGLLSGISLYNKSLPDLFRMAYSDQISMNVILKPNRIIVPLGLKSLFKEINYQDSSILNSYCYKLIVPQTTASNIYKIMRIDLQRAFDIHIRIVKKKTICLVLNNYKKTQSVENISVNGYDMDIESDTRHKYMKSMPLKDALRILDLYSRIPIIRPKNIKGNITLFLPYDLSSPDSLCTAFQKAGFNLHKKYRKLKMVEVYVREQLNKTSKP